MLGHKSIKSTEIYAKVVDSKISDEMDMFNQIYKLNRYPNSHFARIKRRL